MVAVPGHIKNLSPYKPGKSIESVRRELGLTELVKLASNENPFGPSPMALARMTEFAQDLHYYPDGGAALCEALAGYLQVKAENVICGSGSESVLSTAVRTFVGDGDEMLSCQGTFVGFKVQAHACGKPLKLVPLSADYRFDVEKLARNIKPNTKLIYIANPNNPTGTFIGRAEFEWFYKQVPDDTLLIMDEAYFEYAREIEPNEFPDTLQYRYDNVLTLRTFSKAYGIAGLRIGYGVCHSQVIGEMRKLKFPFEPSTVAQSAALGALEDVDFLSKTVETNAAALEYFKKELQQLGLVFPRSLGNFFMLDCRTRTITERLNKALERKGIITRPLAGFGLPHCLRISTGLPAQNEKCVAALKASFSEEPELLDAIVSSSP